MAFIFYFIFLTVGSYASIQQSAILFHLVDPLQVNDVFRADKVKRIILSDWTLASAGFWPLDNYGDITGSKHTEDKRAADPPGNFYSSQMDK